jgi:hypothetical protein
MTVDSFLDTVSVPADKKARLAAFLGDFFRREATLSEFASLRGRTQHYSAGLPSVLPFVAFLSSVISTDGDPVYDTVVSVPPAVCEAAVFVRAILEGYAESGRPPPSLAPSLQLTLRYVRLTDPDRLYHTWRAFRL